jgi:putative oxidoreductase
MITARFEHLLESFRTLCERALPLSLIALVGRLAIAGTFWRSGQTKIQGFALDPLAGTFQWGWPRLADSAVALFRDEYRVPLPQLAAPLAATAEHLFPILLVLGLGTRVAALGLLGMTAVIEWVYPDAWPTHGTWAATLLLLVARGAGRVSLDSLFGPQSSAGRST